MAKRAHRPNGLDFAQVYVERSPSFSSDGMSSSAHSAGTAHTVPHAGPSPAYIAQTEASDLISAELDRKVLVTQPALTLLNEFLDHVLYSILSVSHSVSLGPLKAAVPAVLKPRLGKAALRVAEEELKEYMEDEEAEELYSKRESLQPRLDFDTDLVWKLARLRCMVYARMGDLEEEDEEEWLEKEHLLEQAAASPVNARQSMAVTPGSAIFLTSVIEYLGEQALYYAAQYAQRRHDNAQTHNESTATPGNQIIARDSDIMLEGKDMNHVGRDSPLSRLWRSWRRNTRSPVGAPSRPMSPDALFPPAAGSIHSRTTSGSVHHPFQPILEEHQRPATEVGSSRTPSQIPLPIDHHDVDEIEGFEGDEDGDEIGNAAKRPTSMPALPGKFPNPPEEEVLDFQERSPLRPSFYRNRSSSMPVVPTPFETTAPTDRDSSVLPIQNHTAEDTTDAAPSKRMLNNSTATAGFDQPAVHVPTTIAKLSQSQAPSRPHDAQSSEQLNTTVGMLAGALGAMGVHHVSKELKPGEVDRAQELARQQSDPYDRPLTSASIKRPEDFDTMYGPEGWQSPGKQEQQREGEAATSETDHHRGRSHEDTGLKQLEEHKQHPDELYEMDTPSVYSFRGHSPRFPSDMRANASEAERSENVDLNHFPRPGSSVPRYSGSTYSKVVLPVSEAEARQQPHEESPASPFSSKHSNKALPAAYASVTGMPKSHTRQQSSVDQMQSARARGHSKSSSSSSRLLGFTRDPSGRPQTIYQQRAAGEMPDDVRHAHSSTPNSGNLSRPDTANSASSSRRQYLRLRADSDNNIAKDGPGDDIAKRSLEVLINSDETLHYTLTPPTATFQENNANPSPDRAQTQDFTDFFRNTTSRGQENATPRTNRSRNISLDASRQPQAATSQTAQMSQPLSNNVTLQKPPAPKLKNPLGEARDAQVPRTTGVRDLADYVRSTGPSNDDQLPKAISGDVAAAHSARQAAMSSPGSAVAARPQNRLKFQARDARPSRTAESSALIDFIREGPPREQGDHRINRHIAPFRTTMDSDDLNALASSLPKTSSDTNGNTTLNSNTPLISNAARAPTSSQPQLQAASLPQTIMHDRVTTDEDNGMPKRTRRRIKDPYAIDDSDDDLLEDAAPKEPREESLADFLRNTAPSASMTAQPIMSSRQSKKPLNRTASVDKLKEFVRNRSTTSSSDRQEQLKAQSRARAESPHLTQNGSKLDSYRPTQPTHAKHVDRDRASKVGNKTESRTESRAESRLETRTPVRSVGATSDLADYLKNTGPPPSSEEKPQPFVLSNKHTNGVQRQEGGLKKFFSRRGKNQ
ncbi:hypothetical protein LTR70_000862 [Exophiala xenobiotica]|uniref:Uncharacterized protein n=1 Tax=Lithohypha guttulata TaxID=1690604 RepID=A0ABR0KKN2_9EURO|nr:hypothetical protein LTR24_001644 [Lithohypha guttulata]KAK5329026.1 hypothetical protein LTR70_000862 [Exophiala xenobiotica]